ncbi:aminomethyltransferase [Thiothrix eikelboomii]|uniref:Aminomethyltransferase n=1 Tax=Thiothrix eikelboomii TaxID=92487 RepID=A0A1T4WA34_9GAMM|nr:glycine cleavage T C-terminal barrel domain-containing protein [Thiothrix eikelboomii]SKA74133.1 aminomethyltransferase [Thiothrix eikelboomii]
MFGIFPSARLKPSPYYQATVTAGVTSFTVYNNMLMPTGYGNPEPEYWRIINGVSQWDVACERQVQLRGPDASKLAQILSPRDLSICKVGQGKYIPMCNHDGVLINDPILLKLDEERYWFSIADSNIWFWAAAIAAERGLKVEVSHPDVSPLAIQGPKAEAVAVALFGDWVKDLKYFWFKETTLHGIPMVVARSGWSKQGGFELYLMDSARGTELWNIVNEAGKPWDIGPGNPNLHERVESGLLSYGGDTDQHTNPYEVRLGKYIDLQVADDVIGIQALRRIHAEGPKRHQLGIKFEGDQPNPFGFAWEPVFQHGIKVGDLTNAVWSYRLQCNIGFTLISTRAQPGDTVEVQRASSWVRGTLCELPFL